MNQSATPELEKEAFYSRQEKVIDPNLSHNNALNVDKKEARVPHIPFLNLSFAEKDE